MPSFNMMASTVLILCLSSFFNLAQSKPVPDRVVLPRASATVSVIATIKPGFTGVPVSQINPGGCTNIDLLGETRNDITNGLPCKNFTLIFARGTTESGNMGNIVGPPFVKSLESMLGTAQVAVQGVNNYPADVAGFNAGGSATGSTNMAQLIAQAQSQCPKTKLCVSGYSQGAQVAHNAANQISASASAFINSVVLWGDPDNGTPFGKVPASKVSTDCHFGDDICLHGILVLPPHQDYCLDADQEASFAVGLSGLK